MSVLFETEELQSEEIMALQSIYYNEFTTIAENKFKIIVSPSEIDAEAHVKVTIVFEFLSGYPLFAPPSISLEIVKGLSPCALDELHEILDQIAAKNIGTSSVHIIVEEAKEWLIDNNFPGQDGSMYSDMVRKVLQAEMRAKKQTGRQISDIVADFDLIKSAGTVTASTAVAGLKNLNSVAEKGKASRTILREKGVWDYILEVIAKFGVADELVAKHGLRAVFLFSIEETDVSNHPISLAPKLVMDMLCAYSSESRYEGSVLSNGLIAMANLLYDEWAKYNFGRKASGFAVNILRSSLKKQQQQLVEDSLILLGSACRSHLTLQQKRFLCGNIMTCDRDDEVQCTVCMDEPASLLFIPCGHMCICQTCWVILVRRGRHPRDPQCCFICRTEVNTIVEFQS